MDDSSSDQEYEQIDIEVSRKGKALVSKSWSLSKRPSLPIPGMGRAKANAYTGDGGVSVLPSIEDEGGVKKKPAGRSQSLSASEDYPPEFPPPLPPPNQRPQLPQISSSLPSSTLKKKTPSFKRPPPPLPAGPLSPSPLSNGGPPVVPPKPGARQGSVVVSPTKKRRVEDNFVIEKDELNPEHFVSKYRDELPLHVRVSKGFYGNSERTSVSEGDSFNIHFIKNTKVVCVEDGGGGEFKIALNSGIEFGMLFDPNNKREEAVAGFSFDKVSDLLLVKSLPKVVRACSAWKGSAPESSIEKHELLILRGWKRKISGKMLKAYNPITKEKKELPENCVGNFTTKSYDTRLFLSDLMEHVLHPLPCKAILYMNSDTYGDAELPSSLVSAILSLKALCTETTLVATNAYVEEFEFNDKEAVEIPMDLDIDLQVMRPKAEKDTEDLYQSTRKMLENFAKLKTSQYITNSESDYAYAAQSTLYSIVREGREWAGVDLVKPAAIYINTSHGKTSSNKPSRASSKKASSVDSSTVPDSDSIYDTCVDSPEHSSALQSLNTRLDNLEREMAQVSQQISSLPPNVDEMTTKVSREITAARADMKRLESRGTRAAEEAERGRKDINEMKPILEQVQETCEAMKKEMRLLNDQGTSGGSTRPGYMTLSHTLPLSATTATGEELLWEMNKTYLRSLDPNQIISLLDSMGLSQHQESFQAERVSGEIMLECDDTILKEELKITSRLQRVRLMKVIQGRHSAEMLICGEDPYAYARPK